jgi:hypothetical protein
LDGKDLAGKKDVVDPIFGDEFRMQFDNDDEISILKKIIGNPTWPKVVLHRLAPGAKVIKLFTAVSYEFSQ